MYRPGNMLTETLELAQDGFSRSHPDKGTGLAVVVLYKSIDLGLTHVSSQERRQTYILPQSHRNLNKIIQFSKR